MNEALQTVASTVYVVAVELLKLDEENARKHGPRDLSAQVKSLQEFGQQRPIVIDEDLNVLAGNGTVMAAREIGLETLVCQVSDLEGAQKLAYKIADNRIAELSSWEFEVLSDQLRELVEAGMNTEAIGYMEHEIQPLLEAEWSPPPVADTDFDKSKPDDNALVLQVTPQQRADIMRAVGVLRRDEEELSEGAAVATICKQWMTSR